MTNRVSGLQEGISNQVDFTATSDNTATDEINEKIVRMQEKI